MNILRKLKNSNLFLKLYYKFIRKYLYRFKIIKQHILYTFSNDEVDNLLGMLPKNKKLIIVSGAPDISKLQEFINIIKVKFPNHTLVVLDNFMQDSKAISKITNMYYNQNIENDCYNSLLDIYKTKRDIYFIPLYYILVRSNYLKYIKRKIPTNIYKFVNKKNEFASLAEEVNKYFCDAGEYYGYEYVYFSYKYIQKLINSNQINIVIMWNKFRVFHKLFQICLETFDKSIQVLFSEYGLLPNTYHIEMHGQMGESIPAVYSNDFKKIQITLSEYRKASYTINQLKLNRANRYNNHQSIAFVEISKRLKNNQPIILYAGQNDFESGIYPYSSNTEKYHSPIFHTSDEAAFYLYSLAKENSWNFIYKLHPIMATIPQYIEYPKDMIVINNGDIIDLINICDVFITILSQSAYLSLINNKPVVMLGYNQLKNKECIYEAYSKDNIEIMIKQAIQNGYTNKQNQYFIKHIAQLIKYYSY